MSKTHKFTKNADSKEIVIVVEKIESFERDEFSDCTSITLTSGQKICVSESIDAVSAVVNGA